MPWRPYSTSAEPPDYEDDELMDDIDEGYTDFDGAFVDEGFSEDIEDGFESSSDAPLTSRSMRYGGDKGVTRGIHRDGQSKGCCSDFGRTSRCFVVCSVLGLGGYAFLHEYQALTATGANAGCLELSGAEHNCSLASSVCEPSRPSCGPLLAREVTRLKGYAHHVAPSFFAAPVTPDHRMREQNKSSTLLDSAVRGLLGDYAFVIDPRPDEPGDACEKDDATMPGDDTMRGPQSSMKGWRIVQQRLFDVPEFPLQLRVVRGYSEDDFSRLDLQKQLGAGNLSYPMSPRCTEQRKDAMWAISHVKAWRYAQNCCGLSPWTLFFENDVYPHPSLVNALRSLPKWLSDFPAARMVYLGWCFSYTHGDGWLDSFVAGSPFSVELVKFSGTQCTHAYMLHQQILPSLISAATPFNYPACTLDRFLQTWTQENLFPDGVFGVRAADANKYAPAHFMIAENPKYDFDGIVYVASPRSAEKKSTA
jgi:hypothetical protein